MSERTPRIPGDDVAAADNAAPDDNAARDDNTARGDNAARDEPILGRLDFERGGGLVTVIAQDAVTGAVRMVAHADREAVERTLATGFMHYRSRRRGLWKKGETSGHVQRMIALAADCDGDALLARVECAGPTCHTGAESCFGADALDSSALVALDRVIASRAAGPSPVAAAPAADAATTPHDRAARPSYTRRLLEDRNLRLKKLGEEAAELAVACADRDAARAAEECADLFYHALVALRGAGASLDDVLRVLARRRAERRTRN
jgi:phosphoribosyl-AMP cyclohydrolase / phosphoribosyl-ATP pyrophosphohydrolase